MPNAKLIDFLAVGRLRSLDDVADYAALAAQAVVEGLDPKVSRELRAWGDLMFSTLAAKSKAERPEAPLNVIQMLANIEQPRGRLTMAVPWEKAEAEVKVEAGVKAGVSRR